MVRWDFCSFSDSNFLQVKITLAYTLEPCSRTWCCRQTVVIKKKDFTLINFVEQLQESPWP